MSEPQSTAKEEITAEKPATQTHRRTQLPWLILRVMVVGVVGACIASVFARTWWPFELATHFRVQYCWLLLTTTVIFVVGRQFKFASLAFAFGVFNLSCFATDFFGAEHPTSAPSLRVLGLNVFVMNRDFQEVVDLIERTSPDIVVLSEVNDVWVDSIRAIEDRFPFREVVARPDAFGIAIYSRLPFDAVDSIPLATTNSRAIVAQVSIEGQPLMIIGAHVFPPVGKVRAQERNSQLKHLARLRLRPTMRVE